MTTTLKTCFKCSRTLPVEAFYTHKQMADGRLSKCKECARADVIANRVAKIEHYRSFDKMRASLPHRVKARKEYQQTPAGKLAMKRAHNKWIAKHPERRKANNEVAAALIVGKLSKLPCLVCGEVKVEGHHPDYSQPLDVVWLCEKHHKEIHWQMPMAA